MVLIFHSIYNEMNANNALFFSKNVSIGDNLLRPFNVLGEEFDKLGIKFGTSSSELLYAADVIFFIDHPGYNDSVYQYAIKNGVKMYLISLESPIISKQIFDKRYHKPFVKIFTWADKLIKGNPDKYVKVNYSHDISSDFDIDSTRDKELVIIAGNKVSVKGKELYSERLKCIKWFDKNHPEMLDLFGFGWDNKVFDDSYFIGRILNRFTTRYAIFKHNFKVYRGSIKRKNSVLKEYNFSICFENVYGYEGWITEKIFDCFFAGTIPIYKGAPNVLDFIPSNCMINYDDFDSLDSLYQFLVTMPKGRIVQYRRDIKKFLKSNKVDCFRTSTFARTILETIKVVV